MTEHIKYVEQLYVTLHLLDKLLCRFCSTAILEGDVEYSVVFVSKALLILRQLMESGVCLRLGIYYRAYGIYV